MIQTREADKQDINLVGQSIYGDKLSIHPR